MLPSIFGENLFEDRFGFPEFPELRDVERKLYGRHAFREMKTDVREHDDSYEIDIDLPGFRKDEIGIELELDDAAILHGDRCFDRVHKFISSIVRPFGRRDLGRGGSFGRGLGCAAGCKGQKRCA